MRQSRSQWLTGASPYVALVAVMIAQLWTSVRLHTLDTAFVELPHGQNYKWNPEVFKTLTFGHVSSAVDWLWMRVLQDPAISHVPEGQHAPAFYDLDLATDLDPAFEELYLYGSNLLAVIRDDDQGAKEILLKGDQFRKEELPKYSDEFRRKYWYQAWAISLSLAYVYLFELHDLPRAALAFQEAAELPDAPSYLKSLSQRLQKPGGQYEVGQRVLNHMISSTRDSRLKESYQKKLSDLEIARNVYLLNLEFQAFLGASSQGAVTDAWSRFRRAKGLSSRDPWGGELSLNEEGRIVTTTPYEPVFGLK